MVGLTKLIDSIAPSLKFASISPIIDEIRLRMAAETDFLQEAKNIDDFKIFWKTDNHKVVAPMFIMISVPKVLIMTRFWGVDDWWCCHASILQIPSTGDDRYFKHGFLAWCCAIVFMPICMPVIWCCWTDGRIGFIDFGIVGKLEPKAVAKPVWDDG